MAERIASYEDFWLFYVSQHRDPTCRALHLLGTTGVLLSLVLAAVRTPWWLIAAPLMGYGFAWVGHFRFEKNRPATFTYPLWSLRADFRLYRVALTGQLPGELARAAERYPLGTENNLSTT